MKAKIRYYFFLIRWWSIGHYHCDIPANYKKFWYICNRIFWISVFLSMAYTIFVGILGYK